MVIDSQTGIELGVRAVRDDPIFSMLYLEALLPLQYRRAREHGAVCKDPWKCHLVGDRMGLQA